MLSLYMLLNFSFHLKIFLVLNFPSVSVRVRFERAGSEPVDLVGANEAVLSPHEMACIRRYNEPYT